MFINHSMFIKPLYLYILYKDIVLTKSAINYTTISNWKKRRIYKKVINAVCLPRNGNSR